HSFACLWVCDADELTLHLYARILSCIRLGHACDGPRILILAFVGKDSHKQELVKMIHAYCMWLSKLAYSD
ncbi:hypothetical protein ACJX0J_018470, partial [Zea mays]